MLNSTHNPLYNETSEVITENYKNTTQNKNKEDRLQNITEHQQQQTTNSEGNSNIDNIILSIFRVGPENGLKLFNKTTDTENVQRVTKDFVFPDQQHLFSGNELKCEESMSEGKTFCYNVPNYPEASQLESIIKREFSNFDAYFGEDLPQPQNITQRTNYEPDEEYPCRSVERVIYPKAGLTKDSNWLLILNNHENVKQGIRIEECLNDGAECNLMDNLPKHYRATCRQNYIYRSLVALTPNGTITKDHFKMPSCCKCILNQARN